MPLAFESKNYGTIAFGFFNIESDMLLLERYFFFATDFCRMIDELSSRSGSDTVTVQFPVFDIEDPQARGDLMGAINGVRFQGFIGDTYRKFPFPEKREDFKQNTEGHVNRSEFEKMIASYSNVVEISVESNPSKPRFSFGQYKFKQEVFFELLNYVGIGGYPRWKDEAKPEYVLKMLETAGNSDHALLDGFGKG